MKHTPEMGLAAPEHGWVPSPTWVLRRAAVLEHVDSWEPGRVLDMGCGAGALLHDLASRGFTGVGVELSDEARKLATRLAAGLTGFQVAAEIPPGAGPFDYLVSLEVLEHIRDDRETLTSWVARLGEGGRALISVPADPARWDVTDVLAGHFRRYDREGIVSLVEGSGLRVLRVETYGFPATWLIARIRRVVRSVQLKRSGGDATSLRPGDARRTMQSGIERSTESRLYPLYGSWAGRRILSAAARLQRRFRDTDRGISYLVLARR